MGEKGRHLDRTDLDQHTEIVLTHMICHFRPLQKISLRDLFLAKVLANVIVKGTGSCTAVRRCLLMQPIGCVRVMLPVKKKKCP